MDPLQAAAKAADAGELAPAPAPAPPGGADQAGAPAIADESEKWIGLSVRFGAGIRELVPDRARPHWTPERLQAFGVELASCAKHYGWKFGNAGPPWLGLALAAAPLVWPIAEPYVTPYLKGQARAQPAAQQQLADPPPPAAPPIGV
jgi:hypothetical protein